MASFRELHFAQRLGVARAWCRKMRLFITGGNGFIGSEVCRQAKEAGHDLYVLQRPHRLDSIPWQAISEFQPEVAIHCAWIATPGVYLDSPENVVLKDQSISLFQGLADAGLRHFVGCGTCAEYAPSVSALEEDKSAIAPLSIYAKAKHGLHCDLRKAASKSSTTLTWARIFFPYGPSEHPDRLVSSLFRAFQAGGRERLRSPSAVRDYIHVHDVASGLLACALSHADGCCNIGTGEGVSLDRLESEVARLCGRTDLAVETIRTERERTADCFVASTRKLRELGWRPRFKLSEGLTDYQCSISA
ncbi:MAG: NAD(P)-dependent oxidoreductase [Chthoniobacterales bacterium]|nr:NAD(P)-dependent oxidoreductase [Chthoniobacterales bacterium]